ncbi:MAG: hypothetical protein EB072_16760, partial [Betaproteobacteria bacterium]|nr:hypothetical protein [Betaproteobacteria bacterium]
GLALWTVAAACAKDLSLSVPLGRSLAETNPMHAQNIRGPRTHLPRLKWRLIFIFRLDMGFAFFELF